MKIKHWFMAMTLLFGGVSVLHAQADTNKPVSDDPLLVKYLVSSDWTFTWGNVNSFITVNQGQLSLEKRVIGTKLAARYRYGELEKITNYNEFYGNLDILFFPKNKVYGFLNGGAEFSFLRGVNIRAWGGLGAGFKVLDREDHKFEPTVAFNYEYNNYTQPVLYRGDSTNVVQTVNATIGWTGSHKFFKGKLVLAHNFKYIQDMLFATNFRFDGGFTLAVPIFKTLSAKTSLLGSYQNIVPDTKRNADLIWTIGIAWGNL